jgi:small-conductance mechanosensitive channel
MNRSEFAASLRELLSEISVFYNRTLFHLGNTAISLSDIIYLLVSIFLLFYLSSKLTRLLVEKILSRYALDVGVRQSIGTIIRYTIVIIGLVIIIQTAGVDLSTLGILAGALGVGIGFGLQNITSNFISGIIILFERPIKIGDRIEVGEVTGDVVNISARATTVITNDNIAIIVPNSDFISETVINWSHNGRSVRFNFPVPVSYNSNPTEVKKLLADVAKANTGVLKVPAPDVLFDGFGDSSLDFTLRVWTSEYIDRPGVLKSQLYYEIFKKFAEQNIEIPYPQQDLHLKSGFDNIASAFKNTDSNTGSTKEEPSE